MNQAHVLLERVAEDRETYRCMVGEEVKRSVGDHLSQAWAGQGDVDSNLTTTQWRDFSSGSQAWGGRAYIM